MKNQLISDKIESLISDIDTQVEQYNGYIEELLRTKVHLQSLISEPTTSTPTEVKYKTYIPTEEKRSRGGSVGRPRKGEPTVAATTRNFLQKYQKSGEPFTYDVLAKRVRGLLPTATDVAIKDQVKSWAKKNEFKYESITVDGANRIIIASKHQ